MDSYRPGDNDPRQLRDYRGSDDNDSDLGIQIRGAANNRRASDSRPSSSSRRPYYDPDMPSRQRHDDYQGGYRNRSDDRYDNSYSSSSDYHGRNYHERGYARRDYYSRDGGGRRYESRGYAPHDYRDYAPHDYRDYHDFSEQDSYSEPQEPPASTGEEDVSHDSTEVPFLIIRRLKNTVDEALLSKGLEKLDLDDNEPEPPAMPAVPGGPPIVTPAAPPGATPGSLKRVFLIRDRLSEKSLSYGFAEYHTVSDAKAALAKAGQLADKCTIASKQVIVDFPHAGVFPISEPAKDPRFTFQLSNGSTHRYRDNRYYASAYEVNMKAPAPPKAPVVQAGAKAKTNTNKKRSTNSQALDTLDSDNSKRKKVKTSATQNLAIATLWGKKQAELNGEDGGEEAEDESDSNSNHPATSVNPPELDANLDSGIVKHDAEFQSFVAPAKNMGEGVLSCYLCYRNLKGLSTAEKHVRESDMHKQNFQDPEKLKLGFERMEKAGVGKNATIKVQQEPADSAEPARPEYRDRAKERREAEAKTGGKKVKVSLKEASQKKGAVENKPVAPSYGKGKKMLQNAGWEEGKGLGSGDGISAPIEQLSYAAGVGLGHESSKKGDAVEEAARSTRGGDFLEQTKNSARERFSRMG